MQRKILIFIAAFFLSGCSTVRKVTETGTVSNMGKYNSMTDRILSLNMTGNNFNIVKAEIEILNNNKKQELIASMKYRKEGNYLVTLKNRTGIEAARIYITKDTIMINDRFSKKLYCGSNIYLIKKYGIETNALPLVFGDYIDELKEVEKIRDCENGISEIQGYLNQKEIWYYLDCNKAKVLSVTISEKKGSAEMNIQFSNFRSIGEMVFPGKINIEDIASETKVQINIISIDYYKEEPIEFIPGKNYERIILR